MIQKKSYLNKLRHQHVTARLTMRFVARYDDSLRPVYIDIMYDGSQYMFRSAHVAQVIRLALRDSDDDMVKDRCEWLSETDVVILFYRHRLSCSWLKEITENIRVVHASSLDLPRITMICCTKDDSYKYRGMEEESIGSDASGSATSSMLGIV
jgi:hypothetical protein